MSQRFRRSIIGAAFLVFAAALCGCNSSDGAAAIDAKEDATAGSANGTAEPSTSASADPDSPVKRDATGGGLPRVEVVAGHHFSPYYDGDIIPVRADGAGQAIWKSDQNIVKICDDDAPTTQTEGANYMTGCLMENPYYRDAAVLASGGTDVTAHDQDYVNNAKASIAEDVDDADIIKGGHTICSDVNRGRGMEYVVDSAPLAFSRSSLIDSSIAVDDAIVLLCPEFNWMIDAYHAGNTTVGSGDPH